MASLISHPLVPVALAAAVGSKHVPLSEFVWIWLPLLGVAVLGWGLRSVIPAPTRRMHTTRSIRC